MDKVFNELYNFKFTEEGLNQYRSSFKGILDLANSGKMQFIGENPQIREKKIFGILFRQYIDVCKMYSVISVVIGDSEFIFDSGSILEIEGNTIMEIEQFAWNTIGIAGINTILSVFPELQSHVENVISFEKYCTKKPFDLTERRLKLLDNCRDSEQTLVIDLILLDRDNITYLILDFIIQFTTIILKGRDSNPFVFDRVKKDIKKLNRIRKKILLKLKLHRPEVKYLLGFIEDATKTLREMS